MYYFYYLNRTIRFFIYLFRLAPFINKITFRIFPKISCRLQEAFGVSRKAVARVRQTFGCSRKVITGMQQLFGKTGNYLRLSAWVFQNSTCS
ncbi:hypothetical protein U9K52_03195 [Chryseobacterium sp. MHB01]|uniref:hypothetical protein n=1 Tax=Chryseobacterium sp. MHB01 TaxID=3109433 RepID=UPI002AFE07DA|nr:hypothetical protein [Chryseobacterium sp. MHB01]MEA1847909.1 hypothetical protein [Chryseobacterium sp. MHB01]